jgi:predicted NUDIX family NTP pyrophosphohydrolase
MARRQSAGILLYKRTGNGGVRVFLVHPGGPLWAKKDDGAWSIPKGEYEAGEEPLAAARREFAEETGSAIDGNFVALQPLKQPSGKTVCAWAVEGDIDASGIRSNVFTLEWPPRSGRFAQYPEVDRAEWFPLDTARARILRGQAGFLDQLGSLLAAGAATAEQP